MSELQTRTCVADAEVVVVKIGSSVLIADESGEVLDRGVFEALASQIAALREADRSVVLVSSGAVALGANALQLTEKPAGIAKRQALAAIGQRHLMAAWGECFAEKGCPTAQVLLTHSDFADRRRYLNARRAIAAMLAYGAVPIVNENDTVAAEEIRFGDNDQLSAQVAALMGADLLVLLSTCDGLFTGDPNTDPEAEKIEWVPRVDDGVLGFAESTGSSWGTGGMASKLAAAQAATHFGTPTIIAEGRQPDVLARALSGAKVGTLFAAQQKPISSRKHWIAYTLKPAGELEVDAGAAKALAERGKSLLPSGVREVRGQFEVGDAVRIVDEAGTEFARGLVSYTSREIARIAGQQSENIARVLGYRHAAVVVHRDDLIVVNGADGNADPAE